MAGAVATEEVYELPAIAVRTLSDEGLQLELHSVGFSHYCMRARWALKLVGLPYKEVHYLPLSHVVGIKRLQARFKHSGSVRTASSSSSVATPVLAIYSAEGKPLCLLSNSTLISRYAALRARALGLPRADQLYGDSLTLQPLPAAAGGDDPGGRSTVTGSGSFYEAVSSLELRLSGAMGVEVRRVMYACLLPRLKLGGLMFVRNSSGLERLFSPLVYLASRLLLPVAMNINAKTAERGKERLLAEFDFFDQLLLSQEKQQQPAAASAGDGDVLPFYLCGPQLSAADVSLAALAGYIVDVPAQQMGLPWLPGIQNMPKEQGHFMQELRDRPTGKFVLDLWRVHGPFEHRD